MHDRTDFETMLERRLHAYAATGARPVAASAIARATISTAAAPAPRTSAVGGSRRPALLVAVGALLLLAAVAGAAIVGGRPPAISGVFTEGPSMASGNIVDAIALPDGRVLVGVRSEEGTFPGTSTLYCDFPCMSHLKVLDPQTGVFRPTRKLPASLAVDSMAPLHDGRVLILSASDEGATDRAAMIYDPVADRFDAVGAPIEPRTWPFLVTLADGRILVGGGDVQGAALATAELFDPATGTFSSAGSMTRPREAGTGAVLLPDGRVLVAGGGADVGATAELFDPVTGTFAPTSDMTVPRGGFFTATLLSDGRVLLAGGLLSHTTDPEALPVPTETAEIYDPATGAFTAVGSMAAPRYGHTASVLSDRTVLMAGGGLELRDGGVPGATDSAEIFDPGTGTFRATGSLQQGRLLPAAVTVDDRVLVLGHLNPVGDNPGPGASTEWFE